jgi:hypothetical protein
MAALEFPHPLLVRLYLMQVAAVAVRLGVRLAAVVQVVGAQVVIALQPPQVLQIVAVAAVVMVWVQVLGLEQMAAPVS